MSLRMFIPITKVDATQRLVYGIATGETVDRSGEICDYASTKPFYEKWSGDIAKASGGKNLGNVRAMHGKVAAGVVKAITFNDTAKQIEIAAKIVDDAEWRKVEEGVYTGFSQGGGYVKRWTDTATGHQRYTADPSEVSLVDLPCLPDATFQMVKAAGAVETKRFATVVDATPSNEAVAVKAGEMAKAAGSTVVSDFFESAREALIKAALPPVPEAPVVEGSQSTGEGSQSTPGCPQSTASAPGEGLEQVWKTADGATFAKKADAVAHMAVSAIEPSTKATLDVLDAIGCRLGIAKADQGGDAPGNGTKKPGEGKDAPSGGGAGAMNANSFTSKKKRVAPDGSAMKARTADELAKDLYTASRFAEQLASLRSMSQSAEYQAVLSDDGDPEFAAKMKAWVGDGCSLLVALVQSEADDMMPDDDAMAMAAGAKLTSGTIALLGKVATDLPRLGKLLPEMAKTGARNSAADKAKIQAMHDHAMDLGATCDSGNCADASKAAGSDLVKVHAERDAAIARGDALQKTIDDRIMPALGEILKRVENIEKQPLPLPLQGGTRVVTKGAEDLDAGSMQEQLAKLKVDNPDAYALLMIKVAQTSPQAMHQRI